MDTNNEYNTIQIDTRLMSTDFDIVDNIDNQRLINQGCQGDDDEDMANLFDY